MKKIALLIALLINFISCSNEPTFSQQVEAAKLDAKQRAIKTGKGTGINLDFLIGTKFPEFYLKCVDGSQMSTSQLVGSISFINFWFINCPGCIKEIPYLNQLENDYQEKVEFLAISLDDSLDVSTFLNKTKWPYKHLINASSFVENDCKRIFGYPTSFLLDENLYIKEIFKGINSENIEKTKRLINDNLH